MDETMKAFEEFGKQMQAWVDALVETMRPPVKALAEWAKRWYDEMRPLVRRFVKAYKIMRGRWPRRVKAAPRALRLLTPQFPVVCWYPALE